MTKNKENKVKFNLKNVHYAVMDITESGETTWGTPTSIPGAVSLSLDPSGDSEPFYADGIVFYTSVANNGYEGDLEIAAVPLNFSTDVLGETLNSDNVLEENSNVEPKQFALLFEFDGDQRSTKNILFNCTATRPKTELATNEDKKEVKTDTLSLTASPLANGRVKVKTTADTPDSVLQNWYKSVYTGPASTPEVK